MHIDGNHILVFGRKSSIDHKSFSVKNHQHDLKIASLPTAAMTFLGKFSILIFVLDRAPNRSQKFGNHKPANKLGPPPNPNR
jgi:hypothetical protein